MYIPVPNRGRADDPLTRFIYGLNSKESKRHYPKRFKIFLDYIGLTSPSPSGSKSGPKSKAEEDNEEETLRLAAVEFVKLARDNPEWVESRLMEFIMEQIERTKGDQPEIESTTISTYYKAVKRFCEHNRIGLDWKIISSGVPSGHKAANDRAPTVEEVRRLVEYPDPRIKPIVYVMTSSGIRLESWDFLRWKHIIPEIDKETGEVKAAKIIVYFDQNEGKKRQYRSFITPQAYNALKEWMEFREKDGEKVTGESWAMRDLWQTTHVKRGANSALATVPRQFKSSGIKAMIDDAWWKQGIRISPAKRHEFRGGVHGFRKFFMTHAEVAGMPFERTKILMGHSLGVEDSYLKLKGDTEESLLESYLKVVPSLTIPPAAAEKISEKVEYEIRSRMESKDQELKELKEQMSQSRQEIKDRFQEYDSKMAEFVHDIQLSLKSEETQHEVSSQVMGKMREILDRVEPSWYEEVIGPKEHKLTPEMDEKVNGIIKELTAQIEAENRERDMELQKHKKSLIDSMS